MCAAPKGNKFALGNTWGRPPVYEHPEDLANKILEYFDYCEGETKEIEEPVIRKGVDTGKTRKKKVQTREAERITITGLCLYIGFESRASFDNQAGRGEEFLYIVKRAKQVVENQYEQGLHGMACAGAIFALKNMGWKDKTEVESTGSMVIWEEHKTYEAEQKTDTGA